MLDFANDQTQSLARKSPFPVAPKRNLTAGISASRRNLFARLAEIPQPQDDDEDTPLDMAGFNMKRLHARRKRWNLRQERTALRHEYSTGYLTYGAGRHTPPIDLYAGLRGPKINDDAPQDCFVFK